MASKTLAVGITGAGGMLPYHVEGFRLAGATVKAIADSDAAKARAAREKYGINACYDSLAKMLERETLDAISVITPNATHRDLSIMALRAGKHVFCEKPPARNATETAEMVAEAAKAERLLMFNFNNRHRPEAEILKAILEEHGELNRINSAQCYWIRRSGIPGWGTHFTDKQQSGGGALIDLLHMADLGLYLMQHPEPSWVLGRTFYTFDSDRTRKGPWGIQDGSGPMNVETAATGLVTFSSGQCLSLRTSWAEMVPREMVGVEIQGTRLGARLLRVFGKDGEDDTATDSLEIFQQGPHGCRNDSSIVFTPDPTMGRVAAARHFIKAVQGLEEPRNTPRQAVSLMRIVDAVYESSRTGEPVQLNGMS